ncbi:MAG: hypothetical protein WKF89_15085 [Chitinophagaceae bacterium]
MPNPNWRHLSAHPLLGEVGVGKILNFAPAFFQQLAVKSTSIAGIN